MLFSSEYTVRAAGVPEGMISIQIPKQNYEEEEALRALRTNLQFCGVDKKAVAITSCLPNEGKSSVAIRLAISSPIMALAFSRISGSSPGWKAFHISVELNPSQ